MNDLRPYCASYGEACDCDADDEQLCVECGRPRLPHYGLVSTVPPTHDTCGECFLGVARSEMTGGRL
jgi:hypothetical protein